MMENNWCMFHRAPCFSRYGSGGMNINCLRDEPLAPWEKEFLGGRQIGSGDVTFFLSNGDSFTLKDINFDDISPVGANKECISAESFDGETIYHIPFVRYWTVNTD